MNPLNMNFLLKMGIFQPTMLVYQRVHKKQRCIFPTHPYVHPHLSSHLSTTAWAPPSTAEVLSDYGYDTAAFGKWHNTPINDLFKSGPFDQYPTGAFLDIVIGDGCWLLWWPKFNLCVVGVRLGRFVAFVGEFL